MRPLLSGRDYHALQRENGDFRFGATTQRRQRRLAALPDWPAVAALTNGTYRHAPD